MKGDQRGPRLFVEVKATSRTSFAVSSDIMAKLVQQAAETGLTPVLKVVLGDGTRLAVLPWDVAVLLLEGGGE